MIGAVLADARKRHGHNQYECAKALGVTQGTVWHWENNMSFPFPRFRSMLESYIGLEAGTLSDMGRKVGCGGNLEKELKKIQSTQSLCNKDMAEIFGVPTTTYESWIYKGVLPEFTRLREGMEEFNIKPLNMLLRISNDYGYKGHTALSYLLFLCRVYWSCTKSDMHRYFGIVEETVARLESDSQQRMSCKTLKYIRNIYGLTPDSITSLWSVEYDSLTVPELDKAIKHLGEKIDEITRVREKQQVG